MTSAPRKISTAACLIRITTDGRTRKPECEGQARTRAAAPSSARGRRESPSPGRRRSACRAPCSAGLTLAQRQHQVHEVRRLLALEGRLNSWSSIRTSTSCGSGSSGNPRRFECARPSRAGVFGRERVPRPHLDERIDDEIGVRGGRSRARRAWVYCEALVVARYEYGVSSQPASGVPLSAAPSSPRSS